MVSIKRIFRDYKEASDRAAASFQKLGVKPGVLLKEAELMEVKRGRPKKAGPA